MADTADLFAHHIFFRPKLGRVRHVLKLAATAFAKQCARWGNPVGGGFDDRDDARFDVIAMNAIDGGLDEFTRGCKRDECDTTIFEVCQRSAAENDGASTKREYFTFGR